MVLNYMWNLNFSEVVILAPKVSSVDMHGKESIEGLEEEISTSFKFPLLNWNWKCVG